MNAYQEVQNSGNNWVPRPYEMLYRTVQEVPAREKPRPHAVIFQDFERPMATFVAEQETVLEKVRRLFVMPTDSSVATFLTEHRTVAPTLLESAGHLKDCFGADTIFSLRTTVDEAGSRTLSVTVIWPGSVQGARTALAEFDDWWLALPRPGAGYVNFTYELV